MWKDIVASLSLSRSPPHSYLLWKLLNLFFFIKMRSMTLICSFFPFLSSIRSRVTVAKWWQRSLSANRKRLSPVVMIARWKFGIFEAKPALRRSLLARVVMIWWLLMALGRQSSADILIRKFDFGIREAATR